MKTKLITLFFSLLSALVYAQNTEHLSFKGVPIDGTLNEYVLKMKKNGFMHTGTKDGLAILEGDFASYKNCTVGVSTLKSKDLVSKIIVLFPDLEIWSSLSSNYFNLKEMLTEKYGQPAESKEEFQSYTPDNDGSKMTSVQLGHCKYYSIYETDKGTIELSIEQNDNSRTFVKLAYFDKINGETIKKEALNDL
jgi:hypothetical protein